MKVFACISAPNITRLDRPSLSGQSRRNLDSRALDYGCHVDQRNTSRSYQYYGQTHQQDMQLWVISTIEWRQTCYVHRARLFTSYLLTDIQFSNHHEGDIHLI